MSVFFNKTSIYLQLFRQVVSNKIQPTEKLYLPTTDSAYETEFTAEVLSVNESQVILNQTLFYPLGGGQNWDTGTLNGPNGQLTVTEVRGRSEIQHFVGEGHQLEIGDQVTGKIDWDRRFAHMRMHTAQHLVSGIVYEEFNGARTVGNQIHQDRSRIDFNPIKFDDEMLDLLKQKFDEKVSDKLEVSIKEMTREEINSIMPSDRTNMDLMPKSVKDLRIIEIGNQVDLCPCAGTHVRNIGELGEIEFLGKKSKGKGTQRLSYTLH